MRTHAATEDRIDVQNTATLQTERRYAAAVVARQKPPRRQAVAEDQNLHTYAIITCRGIKLLLLGSSREQRRQAAEALPGTTRRVQPWHQHDVGLPGVVALR